MVGVWRLSSVPALGLAFIHGLGEGGGGDSCWDTEINLTRPPSPHRDLTQVGRQLGGQFGPCGGCGPRGGPGGPRPGDTRDPEALLIFLPASRS